MQHLTDKLRSWSHHSQHLGKAGSNAEQVLKDIIGVYSWHPSGPLSLFARLKSFIEADFLALDDENLAFRLPAMRLSNYMLHREQASKVFSAVIPGSETGVWEKRYSARGREITPAEFAEWRLKILAVSGKAHTLTELKAAIEGIPEEKLKMTVNRMAFEGDLLRAGSENLRSNIISYINADILSGGDFKRVNEDDALAWLAGAYLHAFGPARIKDFQWWTSVTAGRAKAAIASHKTIALEGGLLLLASDEKEFEEHKPIEKDTIDILPQWDTYNMGYAPDGRERFVNPESQKFIYGDIGATGGNGIGTILIHGLAHAAWTSKFAGTKMQINLNVFEKTGKKQMDEIEKQFKSIGEFLRAKEVKISEK